MHCKTCTKLLASDAFYASNKTRCKECVRSSVSAYRLANVDRIRQYDKFRASQPHRVAARAEYQKTPMFSESHKKANNKWMRAHPDRKRAHSLLEKALMRGKLTRWPCMVCGAAKVEGHHPDYSRPLDVVWLCPGHHREVHAMELEVA